MGKRLAESGYAVLVVNPFYRVKHAPTSPPNPDFNDPPTRDALMALMNGLTPQTATTDATAFFTWLDSQKAVDAKRKAGTTGYCMGGAMTMRTAAALPGRIGAGASFHGGGLVTDKPDSPHLLIPKIKAHYLIAIAANDDEKQPEAKTTLREAFAAAHLPAEIEVYPGTMHGWCPPDCQGLQPAGCREGLGAPAGAVQGNARLETEVGQAGVVLGPRARGLPAELALCFADRQVIDGGDAPLHEALDIEFPVLVPVGAKPLARIIVPLVGEAHGDALCGEGPDLLDQPVVQFARPLAREELLDRARPSMNSARLRHRHPCV